MAWNRALGQNAWKGLVEVATREKTHVNPSKVMPQFTWEPERRDGYNVDYNKPGKVRKYIILYVNEFEL